MFDLMNQGQYFSMIIFLIFNFKLRFKFFVKFCVICKSKYFFFLIKYYGNLIRGLLWIGFGWFGYIQIKLNILIKVLCEDVGKY